MDIFIYFGSNCHLCHHRMISASTASWKKSKQRRRGEGNKAAALIRPEIKNADFDFTRRTIRYKEKPQIAANVSAVDLSLFSLYLMMARIQDLFCSIQLISIPERGTGMPKYEFRCNACKEGFELTMSMKERMASQIVCPSCASRDVLQQYSFSSITEGKAGNGCSCGSHSCGSCGGQCHCK